MKNYGWVVVAAGALMTCIAFGAMFSLAVFLQPMADDTGSCTWLYVGSFTVGLGAVAIALAFPPLQTTKGLAHG
jgi:hypothetical protein